MAKPNRNNELVAAMAADPELAGMFGEYTAAANKADAAKVAKTDFINLTTGRNAVRILPPPKGQETPFRTVFQHFIKGPDKKLKVVINCPMKELKAYCPICDRAEALKHSLVQADKDAAKELQPKQTFMCYAIHRSPGKGEKAMGVLRLPYGVYSKVLNLRNDVDVIDGFEESTGQEVDRGVGVDPTHPIYGFDIIIEKSGQGFQTKYETKPQMLRLGKSPAIEDASGDTAKGIAAIKEALRNRPNFDDLCRCLTADEINSTLKQALEGAEEGDGAATPEGGAKALTESTAKVESEMHEVSETTDADGKPMPF